jgi:zinc protease
MILRIVAFAAFAAFTSQSLIRADDAAEKKLLATTAAQFDSLRIETLPNGLKVFLLPVKGAPVVSTMLAYKVGSADEDNDQTGLSHYLEHLLFKGTEKLVPGDIDRMTQRNGGKNNAYTSEDMTVYHFDFAADRWKQALEVEADRMRNTKIDAKHEFQQEKGAVISELQGGEDQPWDLEYKTILPRIFPKGSPYAHPVIGEQKHVAAASAEIIARHYNKWYHPNNASLVIAGGFDPDEAMELVKKLFGKIPKSDLPDRKPEPKIEARTKQLRHEFESKFDVARLMIGYNSCRVGEPDDYVLDVIDDLLATGKTSRLYRRLVEGDRLANSVGSGNNTGRYPGWFSVQVEMLKGKDRLKAEAAAFEELAKLASEPVSEEELKRVRRRILATFLFGRESVHSLADLVARSVTYKDIDYLKNYLGKVMAVTPAEIQATAKRLLNQNQSVVIWSVPEDDPKPAKVSATTPTPSGDFRESGGTASRWNQKPATDTGAASISLKDAKRVVLPNGLTLVMLENRRLPILVADVFIADVRLREPAEKSGVATLVGDLLEEGNAKNTGQQIADTIEATGGSLSFGYSGGSLKVLTPDTDVGLGLLFECLQTPTFTADALELKREQQLSSIADTETQPQNRARMTFQKSIYGDHPYGRSIFGKKEIVEKLTAEDCRKFHAAAFAPNFTTVVIVGDFDSKEMTKKIEALAANWKPSKDVGFDIASPDPKGKPGEKIISDATAAQTHLYLGHLGITRDNPDYFTLLVLDNVLGTGPGFTDRLSANLRDRQGLAYTVNAQICSTASDQPGTFIGYIGTHRDKYADAKDGFLKEIRKIREEAPTEQEVEDAKKYLLGSLPFRITTNEGVAAELLVAERYKLGFDYLEKYREKVQGITPADVLAAAKKYLDPKKLTLIAVGPIDKDGKPLPEPNEEKK